MEKKKTPKETEGRINSQIKVLEKENKKLDRKMEDNEKTIDHLRDKLSKLDIQKMEGRK